MTVTDIDDGYRPLNPVQIERKLREAVSALEDATDAFSVACDNAAECEATWKLAEARHVVQNEGAVARLERDAKACNAGAYLDYKTTAAIRDAAHERVRSARGVLSAVQTAAGSFRDQYGAANQAGYGA